MLVTEQTAARVQREYRFCGHAVHIISSTARTARGVNTPSTCTEDLNCRGRPEREKRFAQNARKPEQHTNLAYTLKVNHQINLQQYVDDTCLVTNSSSACQYLLKTTKRWLPWSGMRGIRCQGLWLELPVCLPQAEPQTPENNPAF